MPPTVWLIANPVAGRKGGITVNATSPEDAQRTLSAHGVESVLRVTEGPSHATQLTREALAAGADLVVAAGGDGTAHEVALPLIGTQTPLALLPIGSAMNFARAVGISRDLEMASAAIAARRIGAVDVGRARASAGERLYFEAAGVGFEATAFDYGNRADAGDWGALLALVRETVRYRPPRTRIVVDGRRLRGRPLTATIAICPSIGLGFEVAPGASIEDGLFDVVLRESRTLLDTIGHALAMVAGHRTPHAKLTTRRGRVVEVSHVRRPLAVHADGEPLGETPARFEIMPGALRVVLPLTDQPG